MCQAGVARHSSVLQELTKEARGGAALLRGCPLAFCVKRPEQRSRSWAASAHILKAGGRSGVGG